MACREQISGSLILASAGVRNSLSATNSNLIVSQVMVQLNPNTTF